MQKVTRSVTRAYHGGFKRAATNSIQHIRSVKHEKSTRQLRRYAQDSQAPSNYEVATQSKQKKAMASDEAYMDFLNKANQDADEAHAAAASRSRASQAEFKTLDGGESEVPQALKDVCKDSIYVSDADEPFHTVSLKWSGDSGLPTEGESKF